MNRKFSVHYMDAGESCHQDFHGTSYKIEDGVFEIHGNGSGKSGKKITIIPLRRIIYIEIEVY